MSCYGKAVVLKFIYLLRRRLTLEQYGLVIENRGETAVIRLQRHLTCESCGRCGIMSGSNKREIIVEALNPLQAEAGRRVILETDDRQLLFISFILYLVPLGGLVAGIVLWLGIAGFFGLEGNQELAAAAAGFGLMAVVFFFIRLWDRRVKDDQKYKPIITGFINQEDAECED
jgi:sigma-E factor negative regulatory protein RseC